MTSEQEKRTCATCKYPLPNQDEPCITCFIESQKVGHSTKWEPREQPRIVATLENNPFLHYPCGKTICTYKDHIGECKTCKERVLIMKPYATFDLPANSPNVRKLLDQPDVILEVPDPQVIPMPKLKKAKSLFDFVGGKTK